MLKAKRNQLQPTTIQQQHLDKYAMNGCPFRKRSLHVCSTKPVPQRLACTNTTDYTRKSLQPWIC